MTEQSKIPVPPEGSGEGEQGGNSLFERANGAFDLGGAFKPAPMPKDLAEIPSRIKRPPVKPASQPEAPVASPVAPVAPDVVAAPAAPAVPAAAPEPTFAPEPTVRAAPVQPVEDLLRAHVEPADVDAGVARLEFLLHQSEEVAAVR